MKVCLVQPAGSNWMPGRPDIATVITRSPPVGLLCLAACLDGEGHEVVVHDCLGPRAPASREANLQQLLASSPDLVGFTVTTSAFNDAADYCRKIKSLAPQVMTVMGGPHISAVGASLLERFHAIDVLVFGEGELTLNELAAGKPPAEVAGLAYRSNGQLIVTEPRGHITDLDTLPFPDYAKLQGFPRKYRPALFSAPSSRVAPIVTSRGCPYRCTFCDRTTFGAGFRFHSADWVLEHMSRLVRDHGVKHFNIADDLFTFDRARIVEICERLTRKRLGITFNCSVRVGHADEPILSLLKEAGGWMISLGIESGDPRLIRRHKPGATLDKVRRTVTAIKNAGLRVKGLFIAGLPGETPETLARTTEFMLSLELDDMTLTKFTPFPGAPIWDKVEEEGTFIEDWSLMNCINTVYIPDGFDSARHFEKCYFQANEDFYADPAWRRRLLGRAWECRHGFFRLVHDLPTLLRARRQYNPEAYADRA